MSPPLGNDGANLPTSSAPDHAPVGAESQQSGRRRIRRRHKISLACEECRSRKVRCDGVRPECTACKRRPSGQRPCTYSKEPLKPSSDKRLMQSFNERLAQLEGRLARPATERQTPPATTTTGSPWPEHVLSEAATTPNSCSRITYLVDLPPPKESASSEHNRPMPHAGPKSTRDVEGQHSDEAVPPDEDPWAINAMGVAHLSPEEVKSSSGEFYGRSSAASFLSDIHGRLHPDIDHPSTTGGRSEPSGSSKMAGPLHLRMSEVDDYRLPPRHVADHLLDLYYTRAHCLYPYLHWPTLMSAYRLLWLSKSELKAATPLNGVGIGGPHCSQPVFYCALNVIFALGTQFSSGSMKERKARARPYARRARHLLRLEYLDRGELALVQALLIMAHYLQSTNLPSRCWSVAGVAYRMAQGLGLHIDLGEKLGSALYREMRRRVWYGCVCLDIVLGMTLGRPCLSSPKSSVAIPSVLEEEAADTANDSAVGQRQNASSNVLFFSETVRLYKILENILSQVYDPWKESEAGMLDTAEVQNEKTRQVSCIVSIDSDLKQFESSISEILHWNTRPSRDTHILRCQRNVLKTRFLHTRILLYRPLFVQLCQMQKSPSMSSSNEGLSRDGQDLLRVMAEKCSAICVQNAQELIEHIHSTSQTLATGAPWFNSYYLYHSAMILTLAEFCPSVRDQLTKATLDRSWQQCLESLERMLEHDPESYRYLRTLRDISTYVQRTSSCNVNNNFAGLAAEVNEVRQGQIVDHITHPCLDPSAASWIGEDPRFDTFTHFGDSEMGSDLFRDPTYTFGGGGFNQPMNSMMGDWPIDGDNFGF